MEALYEKNYPFEVYLLGRTTTLKKIQRLRPIKSIGSLNHDLIGDMETAIKIHLKLEDQ